MIWLIVYGAFALLTFIIVTVISTVDVVEKNSIFGFPVYYVSVKKLVLSSLFFPLYWFVVIVNVIVKRGTGR